MTHSLARFPANIVSKVDWSPGSCPLPRMQPGAESLAQFFHAVAEVVFGFLSHHLAAADSTPSLFLDAGPGAARLSVSPYHLAPVWVHFFWCIVAMNVVQLAWRSIVLLRGAWQKPRTLQDITQRHGPGCCSGFVQSAEPRLGAAETSRHRCCPLRRNAQFHQPRDLHALLWVVAISAMSWLWQIAQIGVDYYRKRVAAG